MALRAGLVASQRLWFTNVNGYGSSEREKSVRSREYGVERCSCLIYQTLPDESGDYKSVRSRE